MAILSARCRLFLFSNELFLAFTSKHLADLLHYVLQKAMLFGTYFGNISRDWKRFLCTQGLSKAVPVILVSFYTVESAADSWDDDLLWTLDFSSRAQYLTEDAPSQLGFFNSIGIDASKTYSSGNRNIVTLNLQVNLWCINGLTRRPGFFDGEDDCEVVSKVTTANFAIRGDGKLNLLIGHPEVPYGLEVPVSTSQTLRQLTNARDLGLKLDWAVGLNGTIGSLHYATTYGRGSGMKYKDTNDPFSIAGRIGTATDSEAFLGDPGFGLSWFLGEVLTRTGSISERWRVGADGIFHRGPVGLMGQLSLGETDSRDTINGLAEVNLVSNNARTAGYLQMRSFNEKFSSGWRDAWSVIAGVRYTPDTHWALSFQVERELTTFGNKPEQTILDFQLRYRL
jgi:hypothetical protein